MSDSPRIPNVTPAGESELVCPLCGCGALIRRHCKTLCERCGYVESCEDNFLPTQATPVDSARARPKRSSP